MPKINPVNANSIHSFWCPHCNFTANSTNGRSVAMVQRLHKKRCIPIEGKTTLSKTQEIEIARFIFASGGKVADGMCNGGEDSVKQHYSYKKIRELEKLKSLEGQRLLQVFQKRRAEEKGPERPTTSYICK